MPSRFDPPYDSPIEHEFAFALSKVLADEVELIKQFPVEVEGHSYRIDLVVRHGDKCFGVELDGKEFHQDELADELRDARIVFGSVVQRIYRIKGKDAWHQTNACLLGISAYESWAFHLRTQSLRHMVHPSVLKRIEAIDPSDEDGMLMLFNSENINQSVLIQRRFQNLSLARVLKNPSRKPAKEF